MTTFRQPLFPRAPRDLPHGQLPVREFGRFRLDPAERLLLRDGQPVALTPKAFDLLLHLVDHAGRLVEKQALMAALWPDATVEEGNLASTVSALRRALGDDGDEQRMIATVPTRGYRFVASVAVLPAPHAGDAAGQAPARRTSRFARRATGLALLSAAMVAIGWFLGGRGVQQPSPVMSVRIPIEPADGIRGPDLHGEQSGWRNRPSRTAIAFSPDGRQLVFAGLRGDSQQLWVRRLDGAEATPIAGTEQAAAPFFSPDGRWIGFWSRGALWKVPASGGAPAKICASRLSYGASWGTDDAIVFADEPGGGLWRVNAAGGVPQSLTTVNVSNGEGSHRFPHVLPGATAVVFTVVVVPADPRRGTSIVLHSLVTGERRLLFRDAADARYLPTGHMVYVAGGTLMAAPFDLGTLRVTGDSVSVLSGGVMQSAVTTTAAQFAVSDSGSLAWLPAVADSNPEDLRTIVWVDRHGKATPAGAPADAYYQPRLSPDGREIAVHTVQSAAAVWIYDIQRAVRRKVPFDGFASSPLWTPDGKRLVFRGAREGYTNLYSIPKDGGSPATRLTTNASTQYPASWTPDGRVLVFLQCAAQCDIWALSMDGDRKAWPVLQSPAQEGFPSLSPDGAWLAYASNESGRQEVWVQPFPGPGERHQVSAEGGTFPRWAPDGRSLYYCTTPNDGPLPMSLPLPSRTGHTYRVVDITTRPAFSASPSRVVFEDPEMKYTVISFLAGYDVAPDGRFLMVEVKRGEGIIPPPPADVRVITNWSNELRTRMSGQ